MLHSASCPLVNRAGSGMYGLSSGALMHRTGNFIDFTLDSDGVFPGTMSCPKSMPFRSVNYISSQTIQSYHTPHIVDMGYDQPFLSLVYTARRGDEYTYTVRLGINRSDALAKKPPFGAIVSLIVDKDQVVHIGDIISTVIPYDESTYRAQLIILSKKMGTHGIFDSIPLYLGREQEGIIAYDRTDDIRSFADPSVISYNIGNGGVMGDTIVYHTTLYTSSIDLSLPFAQVELKFNRKSDVLEICSLVMEPDSIGGAKGIKISEEYLLMLRGLFEIETFMGFTNQTKVFFERDSAHDTKDTPQLNIAYYRKLVDRQSRKEDLSSVMMATCSLIQAMREQMGALFFDKNEELAA